MLELQRLSEKHWPEFAAMQREPEVMADLGGPADEATSRRKFDSYLQAWEVEGISRWAVIGRTGSFLGYSGIMPRNDPDHPLGPHHEVGWRFRRAAWGQGLATLSARQAIAHAWSTLDVCEILSYAATDNWRSQAVMARVGLERDVTRDFTAHYAEHVWSGLVWVAKRPS